MSGFIVLDPTEKEGYKNWLALWDMWPEREVSAHPDYATLFAAAQDKVICLAWEGICGGIMFPLILRPLSKESWAEGCEDLWDATTPYGYGGPFGWNVTNDEVELFWGEFRKWSKTTRLVSIFARFSLFTEQLVFFPGKVSISTPNVIRSLTLNKEEIWRDYAHKVRKNVNRARASGLTVEIDYNKERLDEFLAIYHETMSRRHAQQIYYFSRGFFESICNKLSGKFAFFHVLKGLNIVSTELVLISESYVYSFLGGTKEDVFMLRPNDLLKHEIICWGISQHKKAFVLGGGYGGPDGIFRYKLSFAPKGEVPFKVGMIILDSNGYEVLLGKRMQFEKQAGNKWQPIQGFFPVYRA